MKHTLLLKAALCAAIMLAAGSVYGQTAEKLMAKYKAFPNAEYKDNTEDSRNGLLESKAKGEDGLSPEDYDFLLKHFKKSEQVQLTLDDAQKEQLTKDIQALKGYEMLFTQNNNAEPEEGENFVQDMVNQLFSPDFQVRVYGKVKGDIVYDLVFRIDVWGKVTLAHMDTKIKKEHLIKVFFEGYKVNYEVDGAETGMNDVMKEVEDGNVLFVIDGKELPELCSLNEAKEYMEKNNFHFNHESWVVGAAVKENYPNTDRKVVIEYTDEPQK